MPQHTRANKCLVGTGRKQPGNVGTEARMMTGTLIGQPGNRTAKVTAENGLVFHNGGTSA